MTTPLADHWIEVGDIRGPAGPAGSNGVSITGLTIDGAGALQVTLSNGTTVNAGIAKGAPGGGIDFESSVATVGALPATAPYGQARYVQADGHLYVYERSADRAGAGDGWSDVGAIRGPQGATGSQGVPGTNGVSVTGASINGAGHLILTLSSGGPLDCGVAKGADGTNGTNGAQGPAGERGTDLIAYAAGSTPAAASYRVGTIAIGGDGKILKAV